MEYRKFGRTNLKVTRLGLGLAALGRPGYINLGHADDLEHTYEVESMQDRAHAVLDDAYQSGIRYFDTARSYGLAERFLGAWLATRRFPSADIVTVGSKWGYTYTADWVVSAKVHEVKEHTLEVLKRQWAESQEYLGMYLQLYQIHSATLESGVLDNRSVLAELASLKADGVIIGLSVSGPKQREVIERALEIEIDNVPLFDGVQATWNLLETSAAPALEKAHEAGLGIIIKEALANGRLTDRNTAPESARQKKLLEKQARRLGTTIDALALAGVLAQPWVDVVLSGAATRDQLASNRKALDVIWDTQAAESTGALHETPSDYWSRRAKLPWN